MKEQLEDNKFSLQLIEHKKEKVDDLNFKTFEYCEKKTIELLDPALEEQFTFIYLLSYFCSYAGLDPQFVFEKIREKYLLYPATGKWIVMFFNFCYHDLASRINIGKKEISIWEKPEEFLPLKNLTLYALRLLRKGKSWDEKTVTSDWVETKLKKELIRSMYLFCDEQCKYVHTTYNQITDLENIVNHRMEIVQNVVNETLNYRLINSNLPYQKIDCYTLWVFSQKYGFKLKVYEVDAWLKSASVKPFDPIKNYFTALEPWDGKDHIGKLAEHVILNDCSPESFHEAFRKTLIRNVWCGLGEDLNRVVVVFSGLKEHTGKSYFINFLCPKALRGYYTEDELKGGKDDTFKLSETFIFNIEELNGLSNRDVNELKAYISARSTNVRKPYDRDTKFRVRRTNFWASTNRDQFLVDDTGNTRWLIFSVDSFNHNYSTTVDINNVWAQAYYYYLQGESGALSIEEREQQILNNKSFEVRTLEHEFIMEYFRPTVKGEGQFWTNYLLYEFFKRYTEDAFKLGSVNLGRAMKQLGFEPDKKSISGISHRGYWVNRIERPDFKTTGPHGHEFEKCDRLVDGMTEAELSELHYFVSFDYIGQLYKHKLTTEDLAFHRGLFGLGVKLIDDLTDEELEEYHFFVNFSYTDHLYRSDLPKDEDEQLREFFSPW